MNEVYLLNTFGAELLLNNISKLLLPTDMRFFLKKNQRSCFKIFPMGNFKNQNTENCMVFTKESL